MKNSFCYFHLNFICCPSTSGIFCRLYYLVLITRCDRADAIIYLFYITTRGERFEFLTFWLRQVTNNYWRDKLVGSWCYFWSWSILSGSVCIKITHKWVKRYTSDLWTSGVSQIFLIKFSTFPVQMSWEKSHTDRLLSILFSQTVNYENLYDKFRLKYYFDHCIDLGSF